MRRLTLFAPRALSWHVILFLSAILLVPACDDGNDVTAPVPTVRNVPMVVGTVVTHATGDPVAGAQVSLGTATATTGPDGRFELTDLPPGPATLRCIATGFEDSRRASQFPAGWSGRSRCGTLVPRFGSMPTWVRSSSTSPFLEKART